MMSNNVVAYLEALVKEYKAVTGNRITNYNLDNIDQVVKACFESGVNMEEIANQYLTDSDIDSLLDKSPCLITYLDNPTETQQNTAIINDPHTISLINNPSSEIVFKALALDPVTLIFLRPEQITKELALELCLEHPNCFYYFLNNPDSITDEVRDALAVCPTNPLK